MINDNKLNDNLAKVNHLSNILEMLEMRKLDALIFNLKYSSCKITNRVFAFELEFEDTDLKTPDDMIFHDTSKLEFYRLMLFITDKVRIRKGDMSH